MVDERSGAIWIHGDLHVENFGTYLNSDGRLVFDVNDFDEAYIGHFTWDLQRFAATLALLGWQKALPEDDVRPLIGRYVRAYLRQVDHYAGSDDDDDFALHLDNTEGPVHEALVHARKIRRADLLDEMTYVDARCADVRPRPVGAAPAQARAGQGGEGVRGATSRRSRDSKRSTASSSTTCATSSASPGSASAAPGLPAYNLLVEGYSQALDNDVVLSMKQANVPAVSRFGDSRAVDRYFEHEGHRTVVSQRALQVHTDPLLGHAELDGVGYVVAEVSPYEVDLDWENITEPDEMAAVVDLLGRATAKIHCASDEDSDQDLVDFQVEEAIVSTLQDRRRAVHRPHRRLRPVLRRACPARPRALRRGLPQRRDRGRCDLVVLVGDAGRRAPARRGCTPGGPSRAPRTPW